MKHTKKMRALLEAMAAIERMERGKLCQMGGRPHYNHQTWENGKNVVRYVPAREKPLLQEAIKGYQAFIELAERYADEVIKQTRKERAAASKKADAKKSPAKPKTPPKRKSTLKHN